MDVSPVIVGISHFWRETPPKKIHRGLLISGVISSVENAKWGALQHQFAHRPWIPC